MSGSSTVSYIFELTLNIGTIDHSLLTSFSPVMSSCGRWFAPLRYVWANNAIMRRIEAPQSRLFWVKILESRHLGTDMGSVILIERSLQVDGIVY